MLDTPFVSLRVHKFTSSQVVAIFAYTLFTRLLVYLFTCSLTKFAGADKVHDAHNLI